MKQFIRTLIFLALLPAMPVLASTPSTDKQLPGVYYLEGGTEMGSTLKLAKDNRFEWLMSYGAVDQYATGTWKADKGMVTLIGERPAEAPTYRVFEEHELRLKKPAEPGVCVAIIGVPRLGPTPGIEVWFEGEDGPLGKAVSNISGDAILADVPEGKVWKRVGLRRAESQDEWQWLDLPADRSAARIAGFAISDPLLALKPAFQKLELKRSAKGLQLDGRMVYRKYN